MAKSSKPLKKHLPSYKRPVELWLKFTINPCPDLIAKVIRETGADPDLETFGVNIGDYEGPLAFCIANSLINLTHEWKILCLHDVVNILSGEEYEIENTLYPPKMSLEDLKYGSKQKIDRGAGVKTRWQGLNKELIKLTNHPSLKDMNRLNTRVFIKVKTSFENQFYYKEYVKFKTQFELENNLSILPEVNF